jgi:hypothetical protein
LYQRATLPAGMEPGLYETATWRALSGNFPNGCHVCEIDPETGITQMVGYWVVDDVGTVINPMLIKGQIMGGIAQPSRRVVRAPIAGTQVVGHIARRAFCPTSSVHQFDGRRGGVMPLRRVSTLHVTSEKAHFQRRSFNFVSPPFASLPTQNSEN